MWIPKTRQAGIKRREQNNRVSVKAAAAVAAAAGLPIASHKGRPGMANTFSSEANAVEMMAKVAMDKKGIWMMLLQGNHQIFIYVLIIFWKYRACEVS